jgi:hypothetical protein
LNIFAARVSAGDWHAEYGPDFLTLDDVVLEDFPSVYSGVHCGGSPNTLKRWGKNAAFYQSHVHRDQLRKTANRN